MKLFSFPATLGYGLAVAVSSVGGWSTVADVAFQPQVMEDAIVNTVDQFTMTTVADIVFAIPEAYEVMEVIRDEAAPVLKTLF